MKVAIIGGGACGLALAKVLSNNKIEYELFEKGLVGRKILASGNGKANIGNLNIDTNFYNNDFGYSIVKDYYDRLMSFYKEIGLFTKCDSEGRIYPFSESSLTVLNCLLKNKKSIIENFPVNSISKINNKFYINDVRGPFDYVVLATGSIASFIKKKQEGFNSYLSNFNFKAKEGFPSLVGFKLNCDFKRLNGVRIKCRASLLQNNKKIYSEAGEVILKSDGISGICILNLSSVYARLTDKSNVAISLDILDGYAVDIKCKDELEGLIHPKLYEYFKDYSLTSINSMLKDFRFNVLGVYDYEFAQVVCGGIDLSEVNQNLSLVKDNRIFIGGEMLDVDGMCGGYNLMFAFCCALKIGDELCNIK